MKNPLQLSHTKKKGTIFHSVINELAFHTLSPQWNEGFFCFVFLLGRKEVVKWVVLFPLFLFGPKVTIKRERKTLIHLSFN
jgi:hypothetical protein